MDIIEKGIGRFEDTRDADLRCSEEVWKLRSDSRYESFTDHHLCFSVSEDRSTIREVDTSISHLESARKLGRIDHDFWESIFIVAIFDLCGREIVMDISEKCWSLDRIGLCWDDTSRNAGELPEEKDEEEGHQYGSNLREDIHLFRMEVLQEKGVGHDRDG